MFVSRFFLSLTLSSSSCSVPSTPYLGTSSAASETVVSPVAEEGAGAEGGAASEVRRISGREVACKMKMRQDLAQVNRLVKALLFLHSCFFVAAWFCIVHLYCVHVDCLT